MNNLFITIAVFAAGAVWFYIVYRRDRVEPEPIKELLRVGLGGGLASGIVASAFNFVACRFTGVSMEEAMPAFTALWMSIFVGFNEEISKAAATVFLVRRLRDFNEPWDGMIYAMTVSLGFAVFENIGYSVVGAMAEGMGTLAIRSLLAVPGHIGFAALWGYGLAMAKFKYPEKTYAAVMWPYVAAGAIMHALYDFIVFSHAGTPGGLAVIPLVVVLYLYALRKTDYLLARSNFLKTGQCPYCLTLNAALDMFCGQCGKRIQVDNEFFLVCKACGAKAAKSALFCPQCGEKVL
jgi:RsiW-degrading membrane proteinase PrsW (M82 family)